MRNTLVTLLIAALLLSSGAWAAKKTAAKKETVKKDPPKPMVRSAQSISDPFMGDWIGKWTAGDQLDAPLCAQVVALGSGMYQLNLLKAFDQRIAPWAILQGRTDPAGVAFSGKYGAHRWAVTIRQNALEGKMGEKGTFSLEHTTRMSPTFGAKPPEGALVLFDGKTMDEWVHPAGNPYLFDVSNIGAGQPCALYVRTQIHSPADQAARLELGSENGIKVWLNGALIHTNTTARAVEPNQDQVNLALKSGWNTLLFKLAPTTGRCGFIARVRMPDGAALPGLHAAAKSKLLGGTALSSGTALDDTDGYILHWMQSGPYTEKGKDAAALFEVAFSPEKDNKAKWVDLAKPENGEPPCHWTLLGDGMMEVLNGGILSKRKFKDIRLHIEFRTPFQPKARGQERGNSGVYLQGRYEVQVLDSYGLQGSDNECGAIYKVIQPRVNMCAPPLQWQTYDITFRAPRFDAGGKKTEDARISVQHNGVMVHENIPVPAPTVASIDSNVMEPGPLYLQDHGSPVQYRNIWAVEETQP